MNSYKYLNWNDYELAMSRFKDKYKTNEFSGIYGVPRGGLILAVGLSHKLKLKFLQKPEKNCLWIDDIIDSEQTFNKYEGKCKEYCCWVSKKQSNKYFSLLLCENWVVFPWESQKKQDIKNDVMKYVQRFD